MQQIRRTNLFNRELTTYENKRRDIINQLFELTGSKNVKSIIINKNIFSSTIYEDKESCNLNDLVCSKRGYYYYKEALIKQILAIEGKEFNMLEKIIPLIKKFYLLNLENSNIEQLDTFKKRILNFFKESIESIFPNFQKLGNSNFQQMFYVIFLREVLKIRTKLLRGKTLKVEKSGSLGGVYYKAEQGTILLKDLLKELKKKIASKNLKQTHGPIMNQGITAKLFQFLTSPEVIELIKRGPSNGSIQLPDTNFRTDDLRRISTKDQQGYFKPCLNQFNKTFNHRRDSNLKRRSAFFLRLLEVNNLKNCSFKVILKKNEKIIKYSK